MDTPLSLEERLSRIETRLSLMATVISDEIGDPHGDSKAILTGLRQLLDDVFADWPGQLPFALGEWRGEPIDAWVAALTKRGAR